MACSPAEFDSRQRQLCRHGTGQGSLWTWEVQKHLEAAVARGGVGVGRHGVPSWTACPHAGQWLWCLRLQCSLSLSLLSWLSAQGLLDSQRGIGLCHKEPSVPSPSRPLEFLCRFSRHVSRKITLVVVNC